MKRYHSLLAIIFAAIGLTFLFGQIPFSPFQHTTPTGWLFPLLVAGLFINGRKTHDSLLVFVSAMVLFILWQNYAEGSIGVWPESWSLYIIYIGIAMVLAGKRKIGLLPLAIGLGIFFVPAIESLFFFVPPLIGYIESYFSVLFLGIAAYYFYKQR